MAKAVTYAHVLEKIMMRIRAASAEKAERIASNVMKSRNDWTLERVESDDGFIIELQKELKNIGESLRRK